MAKRITNAQKLQLAGLLSMSVSLRDALVELEELACNITGDQPSENNPTTDQVWGNELTDVDQLIGVLGIEVEG